MRLLSSVFLCLIILGGCGGNNNSILLIGSDGGKVTSDDGLAVLIIPKDALLNPVEITLKRDTSIPAGSAGAYILEPDGTTFDIPARIEITLKDNSDDGLSFSPSILFLESLVTASLVDNQSDILKNKDLIISGDIPHFSRVVWAEDKGMRFRGTEPPTSLANGDGFPTSVSLSVDVNNRATGTIYYFQSNTNPLYPRHDTPEAELTDSHRIDAIDPDSSFQQVFNGNMLTYCNGIGLGIFSPAIIIHNYKFDLNKYDDTFTPSFEDMAGLREIFENSRTTKYKMGINRAIECTEIIEDNEDPIIEPPPPEPIVITPSSNPLIATHLYGTSPCPQEVGTITVKNNGTNAVPLDVDIPASAAVSVDPPSGTSIAPGETKVVKVFFTCADTSGVNNAITVNGQLVGVDVTVTGAP